MESICGSEGILLHESEPVIISSAPEQDQNRSWVQIQVFRPSVKTLLGIYEVVTRSWKPYGEIYRPLSSSKEYDISNWSNLYPQ